MIRNCGNQFRSTQDDQIVKVPFTVCSLDKSKEHQVMVSENRKGVIINTNAAPAFFNDNHVLDKMDLAK